MVVGYAITCISLRDHNSVHRKRHMAAFVLGDKNAVYPYGRQIIDSAKMQQHPATRPVGG